MKKWKIMTIVGTRPEIIKLSRVIAELERHTDHVLVHTGQNYDFELNEIFFNEMGIRKPDFFLSAAVASTGETIGNIISRSYKVMGKVLPDAVLLYGDTNSCLSVISAKRRKIPVFHMEAGNRCFDQRVPEELNRRIVDHLSDINMTLTEHARRYLIQEGLKPETIIKTGSCMLEVLCHYRPHIEASDVLNRLGLRPQTFFVVSAHREENIDSSSTFKGFIDTLIAMRDHYGLQTIVSTHPRTRKKMESLGIIGLGKNIDFLKPLGFMDYIKLQMNAYCVVSDSGTITEESSILGFPAITIRQAHERPEGMDEGTLVMAELSKESVLIAIDIVTSQSAESARGFRMVPDYNVDNVSKKVVRIIVSYIDYVNRTIWSKGL